MAQDKLAFNERFERNIIFRFARWLPLGLGGLAALALVIMLLALLYAISPSFEPAEPEPLPRPEPVKLTLEDLKSNLEPKPATKEATPVDAGNGNPDQQATPDAPKGPNPGGVAIAAELGKLKKLLDSRGIAFFDVRRTQCTLAYFGSCYQTEEVVVARGVAQKIVDVIALYDEPGETDTERFPIPGTDTTVTLSIDGMLTTKADILKELNALLTQSPAPQTRKYLDAWLRLRTERENQQMQAHNEKVDEQNTAYQQAVEEHAATVVKKTGLRMTAITGVAGALFIFVFSGLVLAVIAIERHSRAMQELLSRLDSERAGPASTGGIPASTDRELPKG